MWDLMKLSYAKGKKNMDISMFYVGDTKIHRIFANRPRAELSLMTKLVHKVTDSSHVWNSISQKHGYELVELEEYVPLQSDIVCAGFHENGNLLFIVIPGPNNDVQCYYSSNIYADLLRRRNIQKQITEWAY